MKKRLWSLLLCLVLVCGCLAGCGDKETSSDSKKDNKTEVVDISKLDDKEVIGAKIGAYAKNVKTKIEDSVVAEVANEGIGADVDVSLKLGKELVENYGLDGLESVAFKLGLDVAKNNDMRMVLDALLNGKKLASGEMFFNEKVAFLGLPAYAKGYAKLDIAEAMEAATSNQSLTDMMSQIPSTKDIEELVTKYADKFVGCMQFVEKKDKATYSFGDYSITADAYVNRVEGSDVEKVMQELSEDLQKMLPDANINTTVDDLEGFIYVTYLEDGKQSAWILTSGDDNNGNEIGFINAKNGFVLYMSEDGEGQALLRSVKNDEKSGKVFLNNEGEEMEFTYSNYTENSLTVSADFDGNELEVGYEKKGDDIKITAKLSGQGVELTGSIEGNEDKCTITADLTYMDIHFGTATFEVKKRSAEKFSMPADGVDPDEWAQTLDQEALMTDIQNWSTEYPFIMNLLQGLN